MGLFKESVAVPSDSHSESLDVSSFIWLRSEGINTEFQTGTQACVQWPLNTMLRKAAGATVATAQPCQQIPTAPTGTGDGGPYCQSPGDTQGINGIGLQRSKVQRPAHHRIQ